MFFSKKDNEKISPYLEEQAKNLLNALGGKDNLIDINACITRLRLNIADFSKVNEEKLSDLGSKGNIRIGENQLQIILGKSADQIAQIMKIL
ncbi:PTS glucose/sucrose transporter subunit IIB [Avibacterium sp. 20-129]|uniref:PTS glucose/sucrose transporter subunit IIB n=1 Tax=Avibacterium sp. 20-129 TaxID=2911525 RepID=UPI002245D9DA|nr:PTS glucose/sucrose transporter subunit IIB [Avibacterium sp. 20-129]MCW9698943.1 PTS glucose/sucrose transporter subunit IIB [Avibacterium sp. 20-129]